MLCVRKSSLLVSLLTVNWQPKQTVSYKTRWSSWQGTSLLGSLSWERPGKCLHFDQKELLLCLADMAWPASHLHYSHLHYSLSLQPFFLSLWHPTDVVLCNCLWSRQSHAATAGHKPWDQPVRFSGQQSSTASWQKEGTMCCHIELLNTLWIPSGAKPSHRFSMHANGIWIASDFFCYLLLLFVSHLFSDLIFPVCCVFRGR